MIILSNEFAFLVATPIKPTRSFTKAQIRRVDQRLGGEPGQVMTLNRPVALPVDPPTERIYACPSEDFVGKPGTEYQISGRVLDQGREVPLFVFIFHTDGNGRPAAF